MAKTRQLQPLVDRFRREWRRAVAAQYAPVIQRFLVDRRIEDPLGCTKQQLFDHVVSLESESGRQKATSALTAFFADLVERGELTVDPSTGLADRVAEHRMATRLRGELRAAGVPEGDIDSLNGRRVLQVALRIDGPPPSGLRAAAGTNAIAELATRLLEQIIRRGLDDANALLDELVP